VYLIGSKTVANELVKAHRRGVAVKVVTDPEVAATKYSMEDYLANEGNRRQGRQSEGRVHAPQVRAARRQDAFRKERQPHQRTNYRNHEFMMATEDQTLIDRFAARFEELWAVGKTDVEVVCQETAWREGVWG
jgi:hypothetical protein